MMLDPNMTVEAAKQKIEDIKAEQAVTMVDMFGDDDADKEE